MISVGIFINGDQIHRIDAVSQGMCANDGLEYWYHTDKNELILHNPDKGAVVLAIKMLKILKERIEEVSP